MRVYLSLTQLQLVELALFCALALVAARHAWGRGGPAWWLAATFSALACLAVAATVLSPHSHSGLAMVVRRCYLVSVVGLPYCLFRFTGTMVGSNRNLDRVAVAATAAVVTATATLPFPTPGEPRAGMVDGYLAAVAVVWIGLGGIAVSRLWRRPPGEPPVARRRMRALGTGAALLTCAVLVDLSGARRASPPVAGDLLSLLSSWVLLAAFAPPSVLRSVMRAKETSELPDALVELMAADTATGIAMVVLPHAAAMMGASGALMTTSDGVVARHRVGPEAAGEVLAALMSDPPRTGTVVLRDAVAVPVRDGWLAVTTGVATPPLGRNEVRILADLGRLTGLALDRADLLDRERRQRLALVEREGELAEAQSTAQIGSYSWDLLTGDVTFSDELARLVGLRDHAAASLGAAFIDRVHPADRDLVLTGVQRPPGGAGVRSMEYRVVLDDGTIRWLHGRARTHRDEGGRPVRVSGTVQDVTERRAAADMVVFQALHDPLTSLPNRTLFSDRLAEALAECPPGRGVAVLFLDIDRFKWLNDGLGHAVGDHVLMETARRLEAAVRPGDTAARFGGDEFVVLCRDLADEEEAEAFARRLQESVAAPYAAGGHQVFVTVSVGVSYATGPGHTPDTLLRDADTAMFRAKDKGRHRVERFDTTARITAVARHETEQALRASLDAGEVVVHYQPQVDLTTGQAVGAEALARWERPGRGLVGPDGFIAVAEATGLIVPLGTRIMRTASRQAAGWAVDDRPGLTVGVNLAARQLLDPRVVDAVGEALESSGLDPRLLCLEITESVLLDDAQASAQALERLKGLGVRVALDDFGTGFSSLTYLKHFPLDVLKIDRSFVAGVARDRHDRAIVASVLALADAFDLVTVAEGVETPEQRRILTDMGCQQGQGHLWAAAMAPGDVHRWLAARGLPQLRLASGR